MRRNPVFTQAAGRVVPNPAVYSEWFAAAPENRQRTAVGTRRYSLVQDLVGTPAWEHFVSPETGGLLTVPELRGESPEARTERVAKVRAISARRREQLRQVA